MVRLLLNKATLLCVLFIAFQSHNGAIAALLLRTSPRPNLRFNPTMVRLLLVRSKVNRPDPKLFQSHNGAIAAWEKEYGGLMPAEFQSHNGAIAASHSS